MLFQRLRELLSTEEQNYVQEMEAKEETTLERQAKMRERAKFLKAKREQERLKLVEEKLDQRWRFVENSNAKKLSETSRNSCHKNYCTSYSCIELLVDRRMKCFAKLLILVNWTSKTTTTTSFLLWYQNKNPSTINTIRLNCPGRSAKSWGQPWVDASVMMCSRSDTSNSEWKQSKRKGMKKLKNCMQICGSRTGKWRHSERRKRPRDRWRETGKLWGYVNIVHCTCMCDSTDLWWQYRMQILHPADFVVGCSLIGFTVVHKYIRMRIKKSVMLPDMITQYKLTQIKDYCTTNSHYLPYTFLFERLGECTTFWTWKWNG